MTAVDLDWEQIESETADQYHAYHEALARSEAMSGKFENMESARDFVNRQFRGVTDNPVSDFIYDIIGWMEEAEQRGRLKIQADLDIAREEVRRLTERDIRTTKLIVMGSNKISKAWAERDGLKQRCERALNLVIEKCSACKDCEDDCLTNILSRILRGDPATMCPDCGEWWAGPIEGTDDSLSCKAIRCPECEEMEMED